MMQRERKTRSGFTLIELTLALVFVAFILLTIAYLIMHITGVYQKGLALKDVNATGRQMIDEFSRSISMSSSRDATMYCNLYGEDALAREKCVSDHARAFSYQQRWGYVKVKNNTTKVPVNGMFCTGSYTYIWNTGYALNREDYTPIRTNEDGIDEDAPADFTYAIELQTDAETYKGFRLLKVLDPDRSLCQSTMVNNAYGYEIPTVLKLGGDTKAVELLDDSENNLVLYDMTIFRPTQHQLTLQTFYSGTFILATLRGSIDITGDGDYCKDAPDDYATDFNYCGLNKFNFAMRATGQEG